MAKAEDVAEAEAVAAGDFGLGAKRPRCCSAFRKVFDRQLEQNSCLEITKCKKEPGLHLNGIKIIRNDVPAKFYPWPAEYPLLPNLQSAVSSSPPPNSTPKQPSSLLSPPPHSRCSTAAASLHSPLPSGTPKKSALSSAFRPSPPSPQSS